MAPTKLVGVDVGGTFTDLVCVDEATGEVRVAKVPTTVVASPNSPSKTLPD
jgi:N-methylhydantoinase A